MTFANPWGLLGLLALPTIVAIHLYQRRFPPLVVAGMHLWGVEMRTQSAGRRRDRLPITPSLLLELLAALLLSLAIARPVVGGLGLGRHLVVVLDDSASMQAIPEGGRSFRDLAVEELERRVEALPRGSVVTVVLTGRRPRTLFEPMSPWNEVAESLGAWRPSAAEHEFQPAWDLASQLADGSGSLLFLTDDLPLGPPSESDASTGAESARPVGLPAGMEVVSVGRPLNNVAISAAHWRLRADDAGAGDEGSEPALRGLVGEVHVRLANHGRRDVIATIRGVHDEAELFAARLELPAGASVPHTALVPAGVGSLRITVDAADDHLALDDAVTLLEPRLRTLKVAVSLDAEDPAADAVRRALAAIADVDEVARDEAALIVAPVSESPPLVRPELWWLSVGPLDRSDEAREAARDLRGPYLIEKRHPLLTDVHLDGVLWAGVQPAEIDVTPLVSAGGTPLLARRLDTTARAYLLNVDLSRPNLADSHDWPKLTSNLAELARDDQPGLRRWNYRLGETLRFRLYHTLPANASSERAELSIVDPRRIRRLPRTAFVEVSLDEVGVHEIRDGDELVDRLVVNFFDSSESRLTSLTPGTLDAEPDATSAAFTPDDPFGWLLVVAVLLIVAALFADWFVLRSAASRSPREASEPEQRIASRIGSS